MESEIAAACVNHFESELHHAIFDQQGNLIHPAGEIMHHLFIRGDLKVLMELPLVCSVLCVDELDDSR